MTEHIILSDEKLKESEKWRIVKNVGAVSIAYMFYYTAYSGAANLQSSINADEGLGTASLAAVYVGGMLSNMFLTSILIKWLGTKWSIFWSIIMYIPYILCQVYSRFFTLVPTALFLGIACAPFWCALSTYLSVAAHAHSLISKVPTKVLLQRFFGVFYTIFQMGQIWGNLFSSLVLSIDNKAAVTAVNETMIPEICGANFLVGNDSRETLPRQPQEKVQMITGVYVACMLVAALVIALGLDSMKRYESCRKESGKTMGQATLLAATIKQLLNTDQLLLVAISIFLGLEQAFMVADFTASFVSCVVGTGSVGYVMMTFGISDAAGCIINGYLSKAFGRLPIVISGLLIHVSILLTLLLWRPHAGDDYILYLLALLWGICDSVWVVQLNAYFGFLFQGKEEAAFSNFQLFGSVGYVTAFLLSSYVRTRYKLYLLLCNLILGATGYFITEYRHRNDTKMIKEVENLNNHHESELLNA